MPNPARPHPQHPAARERASIHLAEDRRRAREARAACVEVARRLVERQRRRIGVVPASDDLDVPGLLLHLGSALGELTGISIAVVDPGVRGGTAVTPGPERTADHAPTRVTTRWRTGALAALTITSPARPGEATQRLSRALQAHADRFAYAVVDLSGFSRLGELPDAADHLDAVAVVAAARRTREGELAALWRALPQDRALGIILVG